MRLSEYIELLQRKLAELPQDPEVAFTQSGYYSDGYFADLDEDPQIKEVDMRESYLDPSDYKDYLVLGHSYQSY